MPLMSLFRRSSGPAAEPAPPRSAGLAVDRAALLRELEVSVPAPERLVRWDTATRACPDCAQDVARSAGRCRHCGFVLA